LILDILINILANSQKGGKSSLNKNKYRTLVPN
jgi:hypothetical protein